MKDKKIKKIKRLMNLDEQFEEKEIYLGIKEIIIETLNKDNLYIIKQNGFKTFLKLNLTTPPHLLNEKGVEEYYEEISKVLKNSNFKLRFIHKSLDIKEDNIGANKITTDNTWCQRFKTFSYNQFYEINEFLEYYIEIENSKIEGLIDHVNSFLNMNGRLSIFDLSIPSPSEFEYLYSSVVLGNINIKYDADCVIENNKTYVKYITISQIKEQQNYQYWQTLTNLGCDLMINVRNLNEEESVKTIRRSSSELGLKSEGKNEVARMREENDRELVFDIMQSIVRQEDTLTEIQILLKVVGNSKNEVYEKAKTIGKELQENYKVVDKLFNYDKLDKAYFGGNSIVLPKLMLTSQIFVAGSGFYSNTLIQENGFVRCNDQNSLLVLNRRKVNQKTGQSNYNELFIGITGSGKSVSIKKHLLEDFSFGDRIMLLDFAKEYHDITTQLSGSIVDFSSANLKINPFEFIVKIDEENGTTSIDYKSITQFLTFLYPDIDATKRLFIEDKLRECLEGYSKPTFQDVYAEFKKRNVGDEYLIFIKNLLENYPMFNGENNIDLTNRLINLSLQAIKSDAQLLNAISFLIVKLAAKEMSNNKFYFNPNLGVTLKEQLINYANEKDINLNDIEMIDDMDENQLKIFIETNNPKYRILFDECHNIFESEVMLKEILRISREGRKYSTGITLGTQTILELIGNETSKKLFSQIPYVYFLKMKEVDINEAEKYGLYFSPGQKDFLSKEATKGRGILQMGGKHYLIGADVDIDLISLFDGGS